MLLGHDLGNCFGNVLGNNLCNGLGNGPGIGLDNGLRNGLCDGLGINLLDGAETVRECNTAVQFQAVCCSKGFYGNRSGTVKGNICFRR